jgi:hypothetical protein
MMRVLAIVGGLLILTCVAHVTIQSTGGYGTPHSLLTLAVAAGVGVASVCSGLAWTAERHTLALLLIGAIFAGELFAFLSTAERLITAREALQAPLRVGQAEYAAAAANVTKAEAALAASPETSDRLKAALASKTAADTAAITKSSERGCAANCRMLLQEQVQTAAKDVDEARTALGQQHAALVNDLAEARRVLAKVKAPVSASPLADRLGWPAWVLDLVIAALGSIAANGLACCLLVFASHGPRANLSANLRKGDEGDEATTLQGGGAAPTSLDGTVRLAAVEPSPRRPAPRRATKPARKRTSGRQRPEVQPRPAPSTLQHFAAACLEPGEQTDIVSMRELVRVYAAWRDGKYPKLAAQALAEELGELVTDLELPVDDSGAEIMLRGLRLRAVPALRLVAS